MKKYNQPITKLLVKSFNLMQTLPVIHSEGTGQLGNEGVFEENVEIPSVSRKSVWDD
jgi:hypothetical protein